ncbi:MAG: hypothetical protein GTO24_19140 [candidate division Zixibacteria bacterium]|nr:hypothetical protein [candidate division Zixibacteria bacterium]
MASFSNPEIGKRVANALGILLYPVPSLPPECEELIYVEVSVHNITEAKAVVVAGIQGKGIILANHSTAVDRRYMQLVCHGNGSYYQNPKKRNKQFLVVFISKPSERYSSYVVF